jgi:hypothetical protein
MFVEERRGWRGRDMERLTGLWMLVEDGKNRVGKRRDRDMERLTGLWMLVEERRDGNREEERPRYGKTHRAVDVGGRKEREDERAGD